MQIHSFSRIRSHRFIIAMCLLTFIGLYARGVLSDDRPQKEKSKALADGKSVGAYLPEYTDSGELKLPIDFQTWVFVGSNLGLEYGDDAAPPAAPDEKNRDARLKAANFHNVYINPQAFEHYVATGKFPDKTMLVLDIYKAEEGEPRNIVSQGLFPGKQKEIAVAVKNSARPDGSKTDWAYYDFPLDQKTAKAFPDKACYDCHLQHADADNVWVQFYPTFRGKKPR